MRETALPVGKSVAQRQLACPHSDASRGWGETGWAVNNRPHRARGLPGLGYGSKFQAGHFVSHEEMGWRGAGVVIAAQASGQALGPHWFRCCTGTERLLQGSQWDLRAS